MPTVQVSESKANFPDDVEYFTLVYRNGTEIIGPTKEFRPIYQELEREFRGLARFEKILSKGTMKINSEVKRLGKMGADRETMGEAAGNILADTYEEVFAEAGLKLKIYNREPVMII